MKRQLGFSNMVDILFKYNKNVHFGYIVDNHKFTYFCVGKFLFQRNSLQ